MEFLLHIAHNKISMTSGNNPLNYKRSSGKKRSIFILLDVTSYTHQIPNTATRCIKVQYKKRFLFALLTIVNVSVDCLGHANMNCPLNMLVFPITIFLVVSIFFLFYLFLIPILVLMNCLFRFRLLAILTQLL